jgi:hypothetical protein
MASVCGEVIGLDRSRNPQLCPILSIVFCILHLHLNLAPPETPSAAYFHHDQAQAITPSDITATLGTPLASWALPSAFYQMMSLLDPCKHTTPWPSFVHMSTPIASHLLGVGVLMIRSTFFIYKAAPS